MTRNLIILGPQGSGKSTQAKMLVERFGLIHIDMGASLRQAASEDSDFGKKINEIIHVRKELLSDKIIGQVLSHALNTVPFEKGIVLDGAPRNISQIGEVEKVLESQERGIDKVIFVTLPEEISIARIASRFSCSQCHTPYIVSVEDQVHEANLICAVCGGKLEQRKDDTPEGVRKRLDIFAKETLPVIEHYRQRGLLLEVDGSKGVEEIFQDIVAGLDI